MEDIFEMLDDAQENVLHEIARMKESKVSDNYVLRLRDEISHLQTALKTLEDRAVGKLIAERVGKFQTALNELMEVADIFICLNGSEDPDEDDYKLIGTYDFYVNPKKF